MSKLHARSAAHALLLGLLAYLALVGGCATHQPPNVEIAVLRDYLAGSFSTEEQAAKDADFPDVRMKAVPIWPARTDGTWMYAEHAEPGKVGQPHEQHIYRLVKTGPNTFVGDVYSLPEPAAKWAGAWAEDHPFVDLSPELLTHWEDCSFGLTYHQCSRIFEGGTIGKGCLAGLNGADYLSSEVIIWEDLMLTWVRGYDADGKQVFSPTKSYQRFKKVSPDVRMDLR